MELTRIKSFHPDQMGPLFLGGNLPGEREEREMPHRAAPGNACHIEPQTHTGKQLRKQERVSAPKQTFREKPMEQKAEEASGVQRKLVIILSDRSREIIRLFEERERKRHQAEQNAEPIEPGRRISRRRNPPLYLQ